MRKSLAIKKFFGLQYLLSTIPSGFDQFSSVDFKLRWKRSVKNSIFAIFGPFSADLWHKVSPRRDEICLNYKKVFCFLMLALLGSLRVYSDFFYGFKLR